MALSVRYQQYLMYMTPEVRGVVHISAIALGRAMLGSAPTTPLERQRQALATAMLGEESPQQRRALELFTIEVMTDKTIRDAMFAGERTTPDVSTVDSNRLDQILTSKWNTVAATLFPELAESES